MDFMSSRSQSRLAISLLQTAFYASGPDCHIEARLSSRMVEEEHAWVPLRKRVARKTLPEMLLAMRRHDIPGALRVARS